MPVRGRIEIEAGTEAAYLVVSDPPSMARFAEEAVAARWSGGVGEAVVGATFRGYNRNGIRRWATTCRVTDADGRRFGYEVYGPLGIPISRWQYDVEPGRSPGSCVVTETSWIKVPLWFAPLAVPITGVVDRAASNRSHIDATLERLKTHLEHGNAR
ncbi:MAG: SRPBCC family protein [Nocardioidaceae bacterium]